MNLHALISMLSVFLDEMESRGCTRQSINLICDDRLVPITKLKSADVVTGLHYKANMMLATIESKVEISKKTGKLIVVNLDCEDNFLAGEHEPEKMFLVMRHYAVQQTERRHSRLIKMFKSYANK